MTDKVVILVTAASKKECRKIAKHLVESKLAACVNITQHIESIYRWEGKISHDREYQLFIKSTRELFPEIKAAISSCTVITRRRSFACRSSRAREIIFNGWVIR